MKMQDQFLVPDYYQKFECKGGACRHSCCEGYQVNVTMKEYFDLKALECTEPLRRHLDDALCLHGYPDENKYAHLSHAWDGRCRMHGQDGLCELHGECGADALPSVCRYYPRSPLTKYRPECSCANACEGVLEELFRHQDKISFEHQELEFDLAGDRTCSQTDTAIRIYAAVRHLMFLELQDRRVPVGRRIELARHDLEKLPQGHVYDAEFQKRAEWLCDRAAMVELTSEQNTTMQELFMLPAGTLFMLLREFGKMYDSIEKYAEKAQEFEDTAGIMDQLQLQQAWEQAAGRFPEISLYMEQMMVNHVFYTGFPFTDERADWGEHGLVLTVTYELLKVLIAVCLDEQADMTTFTDLCADYFRMTEFTGFAHNVLVLLNHQSDDRPDGNDRNDLYTAG
ncbi:MAG: flagellin lysine-N-methylase [Butyrivibrio sp.]|jgi:hypothetical protein|nr:flagellin lysine-N-methylase [Butyrivibrio sp.]